MSVRLFGPKDRHGLVIVSTSLGVCFCFFPPCKLCFSHIPSLLPPRPRDAPFATRSFNHAPYSLTAQPLCSAHSPLPTTARPRPRRGPLPQTPPSPRSASLPHSHAVRRPLPFPDLTSGSNLPGKVSATEQSERRRYPWCVFVLTCC